MKNNLSKELVVRLVLVIILAILMLLSIFNQMFLPIADILAGFIFLLMAYDKRQANNKAFMLMLIICGVAFIIMGGFNFVNG